MFPCAKIIREIDQSGVFLLVKFIIRQSPIAAKKRYVVDSYVDNAVGLMQKDHDGRFSMTRITLKPYVQFSGEKSPTSEQLEKMHHQSHDQCFIANSIKTKVITEIIS